MFSVLKLIKALPMTISDYPLKVSCNRSLAACYGLPIETIMSSGVGEVPQTTWCIKQVYQVRFPFRVRKHKRGGDTLNTETSLEEE